MSQITSFNQGGGGSGTVISVSDGNNITITGVPTVNPTVNVSGTVDHAVLVGNATNSINSLAVAASGTVLTGITGADPIFSATPSVTSITITNSPSIGTDGANKAYVDAVASGLTIQDSALVATTGALTATYNNGAAGIGATLTNSGAQVVLSIDGVSPAVSSRILVKDQATQAENGIYTVTDVGSGATNWVLTRATNYDQAPAEIKPGNLVPVSSGTVNASSSWLQTQTVAIIGTDPIIFLEFSFGPNSFAQNFITDSGTATVAGGSITMAGGSNLNTSGSGSTVTYNLNNSPSVSGSVTAGTGFTATTGDVTITAGNLNLPTTTATTGIITVGGAGYANRFIHSYGTNNTFVGNVSGNDTLTATLSTGVGYGTLIALTSGSNDAFGATTLSSVTSGTFNAFFGGASGLNITTQDYNAGLGHGALGNLNAGTGHNTALGAASAINLVSGNNNISIGYNAGSTWAGAESNNICIGNNGVLTETATTRIGTNGTQTACYIAGIDGVNVGSVAKVVTEASDKLGTATITAGTGISVTPSANAITIASTLSLPVTVANGGTGATTLTAHGVLVGEGTSAINALSVGTNGQVLLGNTGADPSFVTPTAGTGLTLTSNASTLSYALSSPVSVANGGTANTTFTPYAVLCAGTTATGAFQNVSGVGSAGQILTSNGAAALPTWQAAPATGITFSVITADQAAAVNNGYICNKAGLLTLTLPASAAVGTLIEVTGMNTALGWKIAQNAGQVIHFGTSTTSTGVAGSLASTAIYDVVRLVCNIANTSWIVLSSIGNITVV